MVGISLLLAVNCTPDQNFNALEPKLTYSPLSLEFGDVVVDYSGVATIEVINAGRAGLDVDRIYLDSEEGGTFSIEPTVFFLAEDERQEVTVLFNPGTYLDYSDYLVIASDDPDLPLASIPLSGTGVNAPTPDIDVDPLTLDFGVVVPGDISSDWFTISNLGDGDLQIEDTVQEGSGAFSIVTDPAGHSLGPGTDETTVVVLYTPSSGDGDWGTLAITSDDPDEPEITVHFIGNGGGEFDYPVAVIDGPTSAAPLDTINLDASTSYDPQGFAITDYEWLLEEAPVGSSTELLIPTNDQSALFLDLAGDYEVQLSVTNEIGLSSAPEKYEIEAIPDNQLHIELIWDTGHTDLDLHLMDGQDAELFDMPGDCSWCNPSPNWGSSGNTDDPLLALDDISGYGPENVQVDQPADGEYLVRVHYFEDNGGGVTTATLRFYVMGVLQDQMSKVLERNEVWDAAYVRWPEGLVVEEDVDPYEAPRRSCN